MRTWKTSICLLLSLLVIFSVLPIQGLAAAEEAGTRSDAVYLSDIEWKSWKMFGGTSEDAAPPYTPSRNCNEAGGTLTIAGKEYQKGLRTHPGVGYAAEFVYDISEYNAKVFSATVGKDSAAGAGNVQFIVMLDGVKIAESPLLALGEDYFLTCDITGGRELTLMVTEGDDGYGGDSSAWGNAMISGISSSTSQEVYLSDIEWKSWKMFGGTSEDAAPPYTPSRNCNEAGGTLTIAGKEYQKGLRTHPGVGYAAEFVYDISEYNAKVFSATVGKDSMAGAGNVQFIVMLDGVKIAESPLLALGEDYFLTCDITGGKELTLMVTEGDDGYGGDSSAWGNAKIQNSPSYDLPEDDLMTPMEKYESYLADLSKLPVSFVYDGIQYRGLGGSQFTETNRTVNQAEYGTQTVVTIRHKASGVDITLDAVAYPDYNAYEWTLYFTNNNAENTGTFSDILGADMYFFGDDPVIKGIAGDAGSCYSEYSSALTTTKSFVSTSGRPSHGTFPYYNLQYGNGGTFIAVGWPGSYHADFRYIQSDENKATSFQAGQYGFSAYLKPGETVRTPLMAFVAYEGTDDDRSTNAWRRWFIDCNMRKIKGDNFQPILTASTSWLYACMTAATEANQIDAIRKYKEYGVDLDYWWMDAGWYLGAGDKSITALDQSGNWKVDPTRFPTLFSAISEYAAENNMGTILWFEPELFRLSVEQIKETNPDFKEEWVIGPLPNNGKLNDLGNEEFRNWIFGVISKIIDDGGITIYRQDFNESPGDAWRANDPEGRNGITENKYCQGYLQYWDMFVEKYPDSMIDNCAAGGGRLDLESMRRSVILHRSDMGVSSDYNRTQSMNASLAKWIVYFGTSTNDSASDTIDKYNLRSVFCPSMTLNFNVNNQSLNWPLLSALMQEWETINDYYYADYYELLAWNRSSSEWRGWEYFDRDTNQGFLQLFRPESASADSVTVQLKGLNEETTYVLTDFDKTNSITATGKELAEGYTVTLPRVRSAATIFIGTKAIEVPDYAELENWQAGYELDLTVPDDAVFVSDMPCESWIMFGGTSEDANPPYRPSFNCNEAGGTLTIAGIGFEKGMRTHVSERTLTADLVYDISNCRYNTFRAIVGKDSAGETGMIQFEVLVDGQVAAASPILTAGEAYMLTANIAGGKQLILRAKDGNDGFTHDSVGWGNAILYNLPVEDEAIDRFIALVEALPSIDTLALSDQAVVKEAVSAFDGLTETQKALIPANTLQKLKALQQRLDELQNQASADEVAQAINALPAVEQLTLDDKTKVEAARNAYDALTDAQKALVSAQTLQKLEAAETEIKRLEEVAAADEVTAAIEALPAVGQLTLDDKAKVEAARSAYDTLTDAQKALVSAQTLQKLEAAEAEIKRLEEAAKVTIGDIDEDGKIDASDALMALQHSVQLISLNDRQRIAADVDKNGQIDASDALKILQYSVGLIQQF